VGGYIIVRLNHAEKRTKKGSKQELTAVSCCSRGTLPCQHVARCGQSLQYIYYRWLSHVVADWSGNKRRMREVA